MNAGLYTVAEIARYFGSRPQDVARMIEEDGLPACSMPGAKKPVTKVTLHGLHGWMAGRHSGGAFMTVEELAAEIAAANVAETELTSEGLLCLRSAVELVFESLQKAMTSTQTAGSRLEQRTAQRRRKAA